MASPLGLAVFDFDKTLSSIETERRHVGPGRSAGTIIETVFGGQERALFIAALVAELRRDAVQVQVRLSPFLHSLFCLVSVSLDNGARERDGMGPKIHT